MVFSHDRPSYWMGRNQKNKNKEYLNIANIVEQTWRTIYPWPMELTYDRGTEFMGEFAKMIEDDYGITRQGTTVRNPQANSILERIHQTLGNIIRTFKFTIQT